MCFKLLNIFSSVGCDIFFFFFFTQLVFLINLVEWCTYLQFTPLTQFQIPVPNYDTI